MSNRNVEKKMAGWMRKQLYTENERRGSVLRFTLFHANVTGKLGSDVATVEVTRNGQEPITEAAIDDWASELASEAETYAEGLGESQSFIVGAFFESEEERPKAKHAFRIIVDADEVDDMVSATETPNAVGLTKQLMRHNEGVLRMLVGSMSSVLTTQQKMLEKQGSMVESLLAEKFDNIETLEKLTTARHEREIELQREETSNRLKGQAIDNVMALLPAVANKFIGKKILPESADINLIALMKFAEALTPQELDAIMSNLSPEKRIAFAHLLQTISNTAEQSVEPKPSALSQE